MKKIISVVLALLICIGLFAGCTSLTEYKETAKAEIEAYMAEKGEENYTAGNWEQIKDVITSGKMAIDSATDKTDIDIAVSTAKEEIGLVHAGADWDVLYAGAKELGYYADLDAFSKLIIGEEGKDDKSNARLSAYEIYKKHHTDYTEDEEEWKDALVCGRLEFEYTSVMLIEDDEAGFIFRLTLTVDKTVANIGETVKLTGILENLSGKGIPITLPDRDQSRIEHIFRLGLFEETREKGYHYLPKDGNFYSRWLEKDEIVKETYESTVEKSENYNNAFLQLAFIADDIANKQQITYRNIDNIIKVYIKE